jgi:hypothetical protein
MYRVHAIISTSERCRGSSRRKHVGCSAAEENPGERTGDRDDQTWKPPKAFSNDARGIDTTVCFPWNLLSRFRFGIFQMFHWGVDVRLSFPSFLAHPVLE